MEKPPSATSSAPVMNGAASFPDPADHLLALVGGAAGHDHPRALRGQVLGDRPPDAAGGPRDQCHLAGHELTHVASHSIVSTRYLHERASS